MSGPGESLAVTAKENISPVKNWMRALRWSDARRKELKVAAAWFLFSLDELGTCAEDYCVIVSVIHPNLYGSPNPARKVSFGCCYEYFSFRCVEYPFELRFKITWCHFASKPSARVIICLFHSTRNWNTPMVNFHSQWMFREYVPPIWSSSP